ncbi:hypothetical protein ACXR0O_23715 [Verrucomicrobiota bacterium sgz303538]
MDEISPIYSIFRALAVLSILALIVITGWNEPLKYRFMSHAEIYALENPAPATTTTDNSWMWEKGRSGTLNRGAYKR